MDRAGAAGEESTRALGEVVKPLALSATTSFLAFASLDASSLPIFREMGAFAAIGIAAAALCALFLLPLLTRWGAGGKSTRLPAALLDSYAPLSHWIRARRKKTLFFFIAIIVVALWRVDRTSVSGDLQKLNGVAPQTQRDWDTIIEHFGAGLKNIFAVVRADSRNKALEENERLFAYLRENEDSLGVGSVSSIAPLAPSATTRRENEKRWQDFWSEERIAALEQMLNAAAAAERMRPEAFEPFIAALWRSVETAPADDESSVTSFAPWLENQVASSGAQTLILTKLNLAEGADIDAIDTRIRQAIPGSFVFSGRRFTDHMGRLIAREIRKVALLCLATIGMFLVLALRSPVQIARALVPVAFSLLFTIGALGWLGMELNMINAMVAAFIFGLTVDYGLFLNAAWAERTDEAKRRKRLARSGAAVTLSAITTMIGVGSLAAASHPALRSLGVTALAAMFSGWIGALFLTPLIGTKAADE